MSEELPPNERPSGESSRGRLSSSGLIVGLVLIALGGIFLLQTLGLFGTSPVLRNWWALFILIPIAGVLGNLWRTYQANGGAFVSSMIGQLIVLLVMSMLFVILLFNLDWSRLWPVFLIVAGLGALASALVRQRD